MHSVVAHTAKGDIASGYTRATWAALCTEVAKLKVSILDAKLLELVRSCYSGAKAPPALGNFVGVVGIEPTTCTV